MLSTFKQEAQVSGGVQWQNEKEDKPSASNWVVNNSKSGQSGSVPASIGAVTFTSSDVGLSKEMSICWMLILF